MNKAQKLLATAKKYNKSEDMLKDIYGIDSKTDYDAIVIAPAWTPEKLLIRTDAKFQTIVRHAYFSSYHVQYEGKSLAWIQCASGAGNLIDSLLCLADSVVDKIIFVGAVGALKEDIMLGELATPLESYSYEGGSLYLQDIIDKKAFGKTVIPSNQDFINEVIEKAQKKGIDLKSRRVYCTDSIFCEYSHLDFIKSTGAELIEMEAASFYNCINIMDKKGIALLCVSDNSASGISLVARSEAETERFHEAREINIPELIKIICEM